MEEEDGEDEEDEEGENDNKNLFRAISKNAITLNS